ncbi:MAG: hypothetical protein AAF402_16460, partial [Pseudomonadota bacterium]
VAPGDIIEWVNVDLDGHTVNSSNPRLSAPTAASLMNADGWDSGLLLAGESYQVTLDTVGTYSYGDATNGVNTATIIVKAEVGSTGPEMQAVHALISNRRFFSSAR